MLRILILVVVLHLACSDLDTASARKLAILKEINSLKHNSGPPNLSSIFVTTRTGVNVVKPRDARRINWRRELVVESDLSTDSSVSVVHSPVECNNDRDCEEDPTATFKPFSQDELNHYLKKYTETQHKPKGVDGPTNKLASLYINEPVNVLDKEPGKSQDKSKGWHLLESQTHNHPYDDRKGWVTLEPVPWSQSQVQKWEPNPVHKPPQLPQWEEQQSYRPRPERPHQRPGYDYRPTQKPWDNEPQQTYQKPSWQQIWNSNSDIITDNRPSHFPDTSHSKPWYSESQRPHTEVVYHGQKENSHSSQPGDGDGHWVLLSSTKGYSYPNRKGYQRSISVDAKPKGQTLSSHRQVRLTVLPALNGTTKTTTSHGGLLEVEQTFKTVDESQREHAAKMLRLERQRDSVPHASKRSSTEFKVIPVAGPSDQARSNAVLAAVGAGMIPATMAMLLPMVAGRKRRSLSTNTVKPPIFKIKY